MSANLLLVRNGRRAEVVAQTKRVAHLVHRHFFQEVEYQPVGFRAVGIELAARFQATTARIPFRAKRVRSGAKAAVRCGLGTARVTELAGHRVIHRRVGHYALGFQRAHIAHQVGIPADIGVQNFPGARVDLRRANRAERRRRGRHPAYGRVLGLAEVVVGVVRLLLDDNRVLETDALEAFVPFKDALPDWLAVLLRNLVAEVERDRLDRLRQIGAGILLLHPPAIAHTNAPAGISSRR